MASYIKYKTKKKGTLWMFKIDTGVDPKTGKRINTTRRGFNSKTEAKLAAEELEIQIESGNLANQSKDILIKDFLMDWLEIYKRNTVRENTFKQHKYGVEKYLVPNLGFIKVSKLTNAQYQTFVNGLITHLSKRTVEIIHTTMQSAMYKALDLEIIKKNPCSKIIIPDPNLNKLNTSDPANFLTKQEVFVFLSAALKDNPKYYYFFKTLIETGLRKGEALSLQRDDIDTVERRISINKTIVYNQFDIEKLFAPPKTAASKRSIMITESLAKELNEQILIQKEFEKQIGITEETSLKLVFNRGDGRPFAKSTLQRALKRICKNAGIDKDITVHGLRHTHAVMMLESGASMKEVQERLGHASIEVTSDIYAHITEVIEVRSIDKYSSYMDYPEE
ncbi:DNA integration/recombination/inversion protein [Paenibacillus sp. FSL R5-192]|uniref:site-specific integrase n=1 Tax=Paenibacillus sp. FSL R5-192 TaxID=1226754 RepID=UPI0003E2595A|nr:tyrosine-type recombinase/integrase [Paenibacillus sp. FSL R5-192]ETT32656.1 DNA integration/recombination/inversion protein [Paenibacillus sp. FSL R5-192]